jgi:uncharacterized protein
LPENIYTLEEKDDMGAIFDKLQGESLIHPPVFMKNNVHFEVMMGSVAYGCSSNNSDVDLYGFAIPPKDVIFPHLAGHIPGFGSKEPPHFEQFQKHHVLHQSSGKEYDITIYNIVKYFQLCMENNPNIIDSLFVPRRCILHSTAIGEHVREHRKLFLHRGAWFKFKGYAFAQMNKLKNKVLNEWINFCDENGIDYFANEEVLKQCGNLSPQIITLGVSVIRKIDQNGNRSKRLNSIVEYGFDVKFAYHVVRLLNEVEQILTEGDLDLERNREQLKAIRRGDWSLEEITEYFGTKEKELESLYTKSELRASPDEDAIKALLLECLEMHYDNLGGCIVIPDKTLQALKEIQEIADRALTSPLSK